MQNIAEVIMVELQQNNLGILGEIFCTEKLFTEYANEVSLDTLMAYKYMADTDTMYLHEATKQPD